MLREFYKDMKSYNLNNKWMKFEFYFRQPFGLLWFIIKIVSTVITNHSREGSIAAMLMAMDLTIWIMLLFFIVMRKKYSYFCLIILLVLEAVSVPMKAGLSFWSVAAAGVFYILLIVYYRGRKDFFFKERPEAEKSKKKIIFGSVLGVILICLICAVTASFQMKKYVEKPAKVITYVAADKENPWTREQAEKIAESWVNAVEEKDMEELREIVEEMFVEQKGTEGFLCLKKTVYQAGIDQDKCNNVLAHIDAETQGLAYYSLVRISHYFDAAQGRNHEAEVEVQEKESGICVTFKYGKSETELAFTDMNEIVGEEGKQKLGQMNFSKEEIISLMSGIYSDEDISFIKELAGVADGKYEQVFKNDPDELSAYAQDALYSYVYTLMKHGFEYDSRLWVTKQDFGQLENFVNEILLIRAGNKKEDFSIRYLKILEDEGKYHMNDAAERLRCNYAYKETVIGILPDFAQNVQLYTLFDLLGYRLYEKNGLIFKNIMQIENLVLGYQDYERDLNLLNNFFSYKENISGRKEEQKCVRLAKETGDDILHMEESLQGRMAVDKEIWLLLYGDVILSEADGGERDLIMWGAHDANAILKLAWLKNGGILSFDGVDREWFKEEIEDIRNSANNIYSDDKEKQEYLYREYLLLTGEACMDIDGNPCPIRDVEEIDPAYVLHTMQNIQWKYSDRINDLDYIDYNIINEYYFSDN